MAYTIHKNDKIGMVDPIALLTLQLTGYSI
jgi:hypothetical protein